MFNSNFPNPKDAVTALRLAKRHDSALAIILEGYSFSRDDESGVTYVIKPGELHAEYWICDQAEIVAPKGGCSCPDYQKHQDFCKHTLAVMINEVRQEEAYWEAVCEEYDLREKYEL